MSDHELPLEASMLTESSDDGGRRRSPATLDEASSSADENASSSRLSSTPSSSPERPVPELNDGKAPSVVSAETAGNTPLFSHPQLLDHKPRARNRSPFARTHLRSHSATSGLSAPPMARARSTPSIGPQNWPSFSPSHSPIRPSSPLRSNSSTRVTPRRSFEEQFGPGQLPSFVDIEVIEEDQELDLGRRATHDRDAFGSSGAPTPYAANSFNMASSRPTSSGGSSTRRPVSPMSQSRATAPSPSGSMRFNEPFPGQGLPSAGTTSPMPSTPTSFRSRSPSISSLDIIEDTPEAEEEAAEEAFNIAKLKAAAEEEAEKEDSKLNASRMLAANSRDKRKRWSVCGAERRGDIEMETIWED